MVSVQIYGVDFGASRSHDNVADWVHPSPDPTSEYRNAWIQEASNRTPISLGLGLLVPILMMTGGEERQIISPWNVLIPRRFAQDAQLSHSAADDEEREHALAEVKVLHEIHSAIESLTPAERERFQRIENRFMPRAVYSHESDILTSYALGLRRSAAQVFGQVQAMNSGMLPLDLDPQRAEVPRILGGHARTLQEMQLVHELTSPATLFFSGSLEPNAQCMADYVPHEWSQRDLLAVLARLLRTLDFLHNRARLVGWRLRKENVLMGPSPAGLEAPAPAVKVLGLRYLRPVLQGNNAAAAAAYREDVEELKTIARFLLVEEHAWLRPDVIGMITASTRRPEAGVVYLPLEADRCDRLAREKEEIAMLPGRVKAWMRRWAQRARLKKGRGEGDEGAEGGHELA